MEVLFEVHYQTSYSPVHDCFIATEMKSCVKMLYLKSGRLIILYLRVKYVFGSLKNNIIELGLSLFFH